MKSGMKILQINFRHFRIVLMKDRHKHTKNEIKTTAIIGVPQKHVVFAMKFNLHNGQSA